MPRVPRHAGTARALLLQLQHPLRPAPDRRLAPAHPGNLKLVQPAVGATRRAHRRVGVRDRLERDGCDRVFGRRGRFLFGGLHGEHDRVAVDGAEGAGHEGVQRV